MKQIYLDYAAATPMNQEVLAAMQPFYSDYFHNPSAAYLSGKVARQNLEEARHKAAVVLGAKPGEIVFTAGATEANNLTVQGIMKKWTDSEVLISSIDHESVLEPARLFEYKEIPVDMHGIIILNKLSNLITDKTVLVSVGLVNNELGCIQPLSELAGLIKIIRQSRLERKIKIPLYLHTDAAQAGNCLDLHVSRLGVDMMTLNGGKIYGPKQSGALYIKAGIELMPLIVGGGQEFGLRSGTENLAGIVGFAKALEMAQTDRQAEAKRIRKLREAFENLLVEKIPKLAINGHPKKRAPHIVSVTIPSHDNERLMMQLDEAGIECAVGSACSGSRQEPSHVLSAIGLKDDLARATLRFSLGRQTTEDQITTTVDTLQKLL